MAGHNGRAQHAIKRLWSRVKVQSCADGTLVLRPTWRRAYRDPGVITRLHGAYCLQGFLNLKLKWKPKAPR